MPKDTIILDLNHSLLAGHVIPTVGLDVVSNCQSIALSKESIESLGFFDSSSPNYATFYPDAKPEDFVPKDEDFIYPVVRALSTVVVNKSLYPTSFELENVLKASMNLLVGQAVYVDHETSVGNALGTVTEVFWQKAYKTKDGVDIPAGINARLKIDAKSNPRLARLLMMDPPGIHSFSVTVSVEWEPSHPLKSEEFLNKLGQYDKDGNLYRRIVKKVLRYMEISLVSHGADPYAKIIRDNQIVLPKYADAVYKLSDGTLKVNYAAYEPLSDILQNSEPTIPISTNTKQSIQMKEILLLLAANLALSTEDKTDEQLAEEVLPSLATLLAKPTEGTVQEFQQTIDTLTEEKTRLAGEITSLTEKLASAESKPTNELEAAGKEYLASLRADTIKHFKLVMGEKADANVLNLIETGSLAVVKALNASYSKLAEETIPLSCAKCHSTELTRRSSSRNQAETVIEDLQEKVTKRKKARTT